MNRYFSTLLLSLITALSGFISPSAAQDVRQNMDSLLSAFRSIQPYIVDQERFSEPDNREKVSELLQELRKNFHQLDRIPSRYKDLPGFSENVSLVTDLLDDSARRLSEGKVSYAWWRLRKLPSDCFTCHATYKVSSHYSNNDVVDSSLDALNQGRFLLATRQFSAAQKKFLEVLKDPEYRFNYDEALRSLLLIQTRISRNPREGAELFKGISATSELPEENKREVESWISELTSWGQEKTSTQSKPLVVAERLIISGTTETPDVSQNDVALLRGTAILHDQIDSGSLKSSQKSRALYLLGYAYLRLPLFFAEDWSELYLERCISEFPGSSDAKASYRAYRDHIIDDYSGTAGISIPSDIKLHLEGLRRKAYGEQGLNNFVKSSAGSIDPES